MLDLVATGFHGIRSMLPQGHPFDWTSSHHRETSRLWLARVCVDAVYPERETQDKRVSLTGCASCCEFVRGR